MPTICRCSSLPSTYSKCGTLWWLDITLPNEHSRLDRLCELNVMQQIKNVASDVFVLDAWARGQNLSVHGWVYSIGNGLIKDLNVTVSAPEQC
jgi:carbonic anhydrase